jgi:hypothetical protein
VDEVSMMAAEQLDILHRAVHLTNQLKLHQRADRKMGIIVTGDFCQLPPVKSRWAFEADCWPNFREVRLEKIWRQEDPTFLEAMAAARRGDGGEAVVLLQESGVEFVPRAVHDFPGTSITSKNDKVEAFNFTSLLRLKAMSFGVRAHKWGEQRREWRWDEVRGTGVPDVAKFKIGAVVMVLANDAPRFSYCNGDLGVVEDVDAGGRSIGLRLYRTKGLVRIRQVERLFEVADAPEGMEMPEDAEEAEDLEDEARRTGQPFYSWKRSKWVIGGVRYFPIRLGYASTMAYVALSRVRGPEGLRVVGTPELLAKRIKTDPAVAEWI